MSGPPLLPGLMDASVWMKSSYGPSPITRPVALTMPVVTVCSSPNGLPIAITGSPTSSRAESPSGITGSPVASTFRRAMSVLGSRPRTLAENSRPSASVTRISVAPSTTWLLVTTKPAELIAKPEPRLRTVRRGAPRKNGAKNWLNGSFWPNGLAERAGGSQPPDLGVFAGHAVHVAGAPERRRQKQADLHGARLEARRLPQPLRGRRRLARVEQEAGEIDVVARLARVEARRLLELPARRPPSAHHPERLAERVVDPRVTRGQANGVAQLGHRARRHAEPRVCEAEVVVRAGVARRRRDGAEEGPDRGGVVAGVDQSRGLRHGLPAAPGRELAGQRDRAARGHGQRPEHHDAPDEVRARAPRPPQHTEPRDVRHPHVDHGLTDRRLPEGHERPMRAA